MENKKINHEKILILCVKITDTIRLIMSEIPEDYKNNIILRQLALSAAQLASFAAYIADDLGEIN